MWCYQNVIAIKVYLPANYSQLEVTGVYIVDNSNCKLLMLLRRKYALQPKPICAIQSDLLQGSVFNEAVKECRNRKFIGLGI